MNQYNNFLAWSCLRGKPVAYGSIWLGFLIGFAACQASVREQMHPLAVKHCGSCHLPVAPALLDKHTWRQEVLPAMARQLGVGVWQGNYFPEEKAMLPFDEWMELVRWYDLLAPEKLPEVIRPDPILTGWGPFRLKEPPGDFTKAATTTLVAFDKENNRLLRGAGAENTLEFYAPDLHLAFRQQMNSPPVHVNLTSKGGPVITCIGDLLATDFPAGAIIRHNGIRDEVLAAEIIRPVHTVAGDFNNDGRTDYVVCEFGHTKGSVFWLEQQAEGSFLKKEMTSVPGAAQALAGDFNQDGWQDVMVLFAHGNEGIWLFENTGQGSFREQHLLRFPPVYGSSSFEIADMNGDGKPDIVYTAGDNSDFSRILKPYHGVYIYLNTSEEGGFHYEQAYFYPVNGCTKVAIRDFDNDGDLDMATIAFFADFQAHPEEAFIYFESKGAGGPPSFQPIAVPVTTKGRWICMDVADVDNDGDADILLGNYATGFINQKQHPPHWSRFLPFILLENTTR